MGFIIKPLVTEKMTKITDKSSLEKNLRASNAKAAEKLGIKGEKFSYVVKRKGKADEKKEKTIYPYTKPSQMVYGFIVKPEANKVNAYKILNADVLVITENSLKTIDEILNK